MWLCNDYNNRSEVIIDNEIKVEKKQYQNKIIFKTGIKIYACLHVII